MPRILKTNTAVRFTVGPFVDISNGYGLKTGMTVTNLAMNMWHEHDDGSAPTKSIDAVSFTASGGNNDMVELAGGYYDIEITAAQVNFLGRAKFQIYDVDVCLPYFEDWIVVPAAVYDALTGGANGMIPTDVLAISGDTTAADNLELMYDGTGYAGGTTKLGVNVVSMATDTITSTAIQADAIDAAAVKADAVTKIQSGLSTLTAAQVWDALLTSITTSGSIGKLLKDDIDAAISTRGTGTSTLTAAQVWDQLLTAITTTGSIGKLLKDDINAAIDTRMATFTYTAPDNTGIGNALTQATEANTHAHSIESKVDTIDTIIDDLHGTDIPAIKTETAAIKLKTDNLPASPSSLTAQQVWEYATRTVSSYGTLVADIATAVWGAVSRTLTSGGSLTAQETRDAMKLAPTAGAPAADSIDADIDLIHAKTDQMVFTTPNKVDATAIATVDEAAIAAAVIAGLGGATITVQSMITAGGDITIIKGVTYTTELILTYTYTGSLTGYTAAMNCHNAGITDKAVTIGGTAGAYTLTIAFTGAQSTALTECLDSYSIVFTKTADDTDLGYGVEGNLQVRKWAGLA